MSSISSSRGAARSVRRYAVVPRLRSWPTADASTKILVRSSPETSFHLEARSLPVTITGSPLRTDAFTLCASPRHAFTVSQTVSWSRHDPLARSNHRGVEPTRNMASALLPLPSLNSTSVPT
jgi:hypothetical protein